MTLSRGGSGGDRGVWGVLGEAELEGWPGVPRRVERWGFTGGRPTIIRPEGTPYFRILNSELLISYVLPNRLSIAAFVILNATGLPCGQYVTSGCSYSSDMSAVSAFSSFLSPPFIAPLQQT